ncbi:peptidoglycan-binding protein [Streptomyces flavotricini]|uniref:Peptidoglycan-binding protein n=1 Tax=Streptomyces flavotricini TaxID=66888 RepID=A0ABS8E0C5_9ACTN|nr:peptidoglycan-binding domain-containing protein [Streptomyces flavotricini]MCC0094393.1 peptidoglycan-binding protein [Streptomyces flavotricini]
MNLLMRKSAATATIVASLLIGAAALTTGTASAADGPDIQGLSCGFDHRNPPPTVQAGSTGNTVKEAQCLLRFWTGLQLTEEEPEGVFGPDATSATEFFQGERGLPTTGVVDARTWAELRHG